MESTVIDRILPVAAQLAFHGNYGPALTLLDALEELAVEGHALMQARLLRAKILAQQGGFEQAINEWDKVLALEPEHQEARLGKNTALAFRDGKRREPAIRKLLAAAASLLGMVFGAGPERNHRLAFNRREPYRPLHQRIATLEHSLALMDARFGASLTRLESLLTQLQRDLSKLETLTAHQTCELRKQDCSAEAAVQECEQDGHKTSPS